MFLRSLFNLLKFYCMSPWTCSRTEKICSFCPRHSSLWQHGCRKIDLVESWWKASAPRRVCRDKSLVHWFRQGSWNWQCLKVTIIGGTHCFTLSTGVRVNVVFFWEWDSKLMRSRQCLCNPKTVTSSQKTKECRITAECGSHIWMAFLYSCTCGTDSSRCWCLQGWGVVQIAAISKSDLVVFGRAQRVIQTLEAQPPFF